MISLETVTENSCPSGRKNKKCFKSLLQKSNSAPVHALAVFLY